MDKLKQNKFWVGIVAASVGLVAFYGILVLGAQGEVSMYQGRNFSTTGNLATLKMAMPVPGKPDIENWKAYRDSLVDGYKSITTYFAKNDAPLEAWFSGLENPSRDGFMTRYRDEIKKIETALEEKGVGIGVLQDPDDPESTRDFGFNWEDPQAYWDKIPQLSDVLTMVEDPR